MKIIKLTQFPDGSPVYVNLAGIHYLFPAMREKYNHITRSHTATKCTEIVFGIVTAEDSDVFTVNESCEYILQQISESR